MQDSYTLKADKSMSQSAARVLTRIDADAEIIDRIVNNIVDNYCKDLDDIMSNILAILQDDSLIPGDEELDIMVMKLPAVLYFVSDAQENIGIREDVAKALEREVKQKARTNAPAGLTVADKDAIADLASMQEVMTKCAISRANSKIKSRVNIALEMISSIKKVISRRLALMEITRTDNLGA